MNENINEGIKKYVAMQKNLYSGWDPISLVGSYQWHDNFPYITNFLYRNGDLNKPLLDNLSEKIALDFGCGPGRMIKRMNKIFKRVDGVDTSQNVLDYAKNIFGLNNLYLSSGYDIGEASKNKYDFIYTCITMQHIASRTIRNMIFDEFSKVLNKDGIVSIEIAYYEDSSFLGVNAEYMEDKYDAKSTNGGCDVIINEKVLPLFINDLSNYFTNINYHLVRVNDKFNNLGGAQHPQCELSHFLFIYGNPK